MAIKNFEEYFMTHQYMPKIFHGPHKNPLALPPTYLMYGPLIIELLQPRKDLVLTLLKKHKNLLEFTLQ